MDNFTSDLRIRVWDKNRTGCSYPQIGWESDEEVELYEEFDGMTIDEVRELLQWEEDNEE